jgi:hypothetical protein
MMSADLMEGAMASHRRIWRRVLEGGNFGPSVIRAISNEQRKNDQQSPRLGFIRPREMSGRKGSIRSGRLKECNVGLGHVLSFSEYFEILLRDKDLERS